MMACTKQHYFCYFYLLNNIYNIFILNYLYYVLCYCTFFTILTIKSHITPAVPSAYHRLKNTGLELGKVCSDFNT